MRRFLRSVAAGLMGLAHGLRSERNLRIHGVAAILVIAAGFFFKLAALEWIAVLFCIGLVIAGELMNTALERLADRISLERSLLIKQAKDCGAGAVLVLSIMAALVGFIVFGPKVWAWAGW